MLFDHDPRYIAFLVRHPGVWPEVGALEDKTVLRKLRAQRRSLGLPADRWRRPNLSSNLVKGDAR